MSINQRIRELRKDLGLTQKDFGTRIGLKGGTVSWMEKEGNSIIDQNKRLICEKFGVSMQWLESGDGDQYVSKSRTDELALWGEKLSQSPSDSFPKRFATALSRLGKAEWSVLEKIINDLDEESIRDFLQSMGIHSLRCDFDPNNHKGDFIYLSLYPFDSTDPRQSFPLSYVASYPGIAKEVTHIMTAADDDEKDKLITKFKKDHLASHYAMLSGTTYIDGNIIANVSKEVAQKHFEQQVKSSTLSASDREQAHVKLDQELDAAEQDASASPSTDSEKRA